MIIRLLSITGGLQGGVGIRSGRSGRGRGGEGEGREGGGNVGRRKKGKVKDFKFLYMRGD